MNLGFDFRRGPGFLPDALEYLTARVNVMWGKEHDPTSGGHTNITATHVQAGEVQTRKVQADKIRVDGLVVDGETHLLQTLTVDKDVNTGGNANIQGYVLANGNVQTGQTLIGSNAVLAQSVQEYGRSLPQGVPWPVPFNPADFFAPVGHGWSVTAPAMVTNVVGLIGKQATWAVMLLNSTITGAPPHLRITLPFGLRLPYTVAGPTAMIYAGGYLAGNVSANPGDTAVYVSRLDAAAFPAGATHVYFTYTFWIQ